MSGDGWRTWRAAMADALYGPRGFYRSAGAPARHFRTAAHTGPAWSTAITGLIERAYDDLGQPAEFSVVEMGAGHGELLRGLLEPGAGRWRLVGVEVAPRPLHLPTEIEWQPLPPEGFVGVLLAMEWLDVVPVDVVELTEDGPRLVEVRGNGEERLGDRASAEDRAWLDAWWPLAEVGDRAEIGWPRDEAWRDAVAGLRAGLAVAVDYPAVPARDVAGTLTGYKEGRQVMPVPDGSMDITAHVLFESLAGDGELVSQRDALRELGVQGRRPSYEGDPGNYLNALSQAGDEAELLDPGGLGAFTWLLQTVRGSPT